FSYAPGWQAAISCIPTLPLINMQTLSSHTLCEGVIFDSGGASSNYGNNEDMVTVITPLSANDYLSVDFPTRFSLGSGDTLFVYNGSIATGDLLGVYLGFNQHETIVSRHPGASLSFHFKSDGAGTAQGWQGEISCSTQPPVAQYTMGSGIRYFACGGQFYDDGGEFWDYRNNQDKTLTLVSNTGCHIGLDFTQWLMYTYDEIYVYDGMTTSDPLLGHFVHYTPDPNIVTASGTAMTIRFNSTVSNDGPGWAANIFCGSGSNPQISVNQGSLTACVGDTVELSLPGSDTYLWNTGDLGSSLSVTNTGSYSATVTDSVGCVKITDTVDIVVNPLPIVPTISASGPLTFCQGDDVVLTSSIESAYLWNDGSTSSQITVNNSGFYDVTVYNQFNCASSSTPTEVVVNPLPAAPTISASGSLTFCQGDDVVLTSSTENAYLWNTGATSSQITVTNAGVYDVTVYNQFNCAATSSPTQVFVSALPPTPTITANGQVLTSSAAFGNQWYLNGQLILGATNSSITATDNGDYTVIVTVDFCSSLSSTPYSIAGLSIDEIDHLQLSVYPNPTSGVLSIQSTEQITHIKLYNLQGQLVFEQDSQFSSVDLTPFRKGMYWLRITTSNKQHERKVILQ
ncbi:MAG: T9SS type A sorting domain-containing protein, partial [Crocinitomicaceae bacterium]